MVDFVLETVQGLLLFFFASLPVPTASFQSLFWFYVDSLLTLDNDDGRGFMFVTVRVGHFHSQFPRVAIQQKMRVHVYCILLGCAVLLYHS